MPRPDLAQRERAALCDLFEQVGPGAPTLCEGWSARDLAAHLVVRERRPDAALGIVAAPLARHGERVRRQVAVRPWPELVDQVRAGPPWWSPQRLGPVDRATNTVEFLVHHEDVRRAAEGWRPRHLPAEAQDAVWASLGRTGRLLVRRSPAGVVVATPDGRSARLRAGPPEVVVRGEPVELALFATGRQAHAVVDLSGPPGAVEAVRAARLGI